ncbi:MAG: hypothetical protein L0H63_04215 [Nitrococcus sp.]|nr:hypothetical protein [Nitrococcus sp.]
MTRPFHRRYHRDNCSHSDVLAETFMGKHKSREAPARLARTAAMYLCQRVGAMTLAQITKAFGLASYASAGIRGGWTED